MCILAHRAPPGHYGKGVILSGIHHVSLNVTDTARALVFYRDTLGLAPLSRPPFPFDGAWLDAGDGRQVHLIETASVPPDVGQHVAFQVVDIDAAIEHLRAAGYDVTDARAVPDTSIVQAFAIDPDGNRVELTQP